MNDLMSSCTVEIPWQKSQEKNISRLCLVDDISATKQATTSAYIVILFSVVIVFALCFFVVVVVVVVPVYWFCFVCFSLKGFLFLGSTLIYW